MAKITAIDVIKGISGKFGGHSNEYFATNRNNNQIRLAKFTNPYTGPATERQEEIRGIFGIRAKAVTTWLNTNKPSEINGGKGTELYQLAKSRAKQYGLASITSYIYKCTDNEGKVTVPGE